MANNNKNIVLNVPTLRFPEFGGEWKKCNLGDICSFFSGGTPSSSNKEYYDGVIPFIRSGEIHSKKTELFISEEGYRNSTTKMVQTGDLLMAIYGATSGDIAIGKIDGAINQAILCLRTVENKMFIKSVWQKHVNKILLTYLQGGQGNLSAEIVKKISINIPEYSKEQEKLASLMSLIDERISTQNKIIEDMRKLKSAIIKRIFSVEYLCQRRKILLSDISLKITKKNTDNKITNVLSNSANQGIVSQEIIFDREIANKENTSGYYIIKCGDFVYNPRKSTAAPYGPINKYEGSIDGIISPLYVCFSTQNINRNYLYWYFQSKAWYKYIYKNGDTGTRHDRVSIKDDIFFAMPLYIHNPVEQQSISKNLSKIELKITIEEHQLELLFQQKTYLLQQMFI
ncbi:MAG: restriction endonuclease subunit S [Bacteroidales bacterium]|nr:restriction endonuclease subunit S [Bacteroidales bacterium]